MPQPPIIGSSGSYNNPRGNPRHGRTASGQAFQNVQAAVGNAYLLEDIAAGAEGLVRFVDRATNEIDTVMTPMTAKNISQRDFAKSSIMTFFRLPGITAPLLLVGDENDPIITPDPLPPVGAFMIDTTIGYVDDLEEETTIHITRTGTPTVTDGFLISDPDPGGDGSGDYVVQMRFGAGIGEPGQALTIDVGDSDVTDTTGAIPPANVPEVTGTLTALNDFFTGATTGFITGTVEPNRVYTLNISVEAPDGRTSSQIYYLVTFPPEAPIYVDSTLNLYVSVSGDDTDGDGTTGNPYATVNRALNDLNRRILSPDTVANIVVKDGTIAESASIVIEHPNGINVNITGENTYSKSMTSVQSSSGAAGAWSVIINLNNVTNIAVGDYAIIYTASGGTLPTYIAGCHEITNVDSGNSRITLASKHLAATAPSGNVAATVTIVKSILEFTDTHGITLNSNSTLGSVTKCVLVGSGSSFHYGINSFAGGICNLGASVGFSNWHAGVSSQGSGVVTGQFASSWSDYGAWLFDHGVIYSFSNSVISGCPVGLGVFRMSEAQFESSLITGCTTGCESAICACADLYNTDITGPVTWGVFVVNHSYLNIETGSTEAGSAGTANIPSDVLAPDGSYIHFNTCPDKSLKLAADSAITNLSEQSLTGMSFSVVAGEKWTVEIEGACSGNNTTGDMAINLMNSGTWVAARSNYQGTRYNGGGTLTADAATAFSSTTRLAASPGVTVGNGDGNIYPFRFTAQFDVDGTGTVSLVWGNAAAAAGRTSTLYAGARLRARRLKA